MRVSWTHLLIGPKIHKHRGSKTSLDSVFELQKKPSMDSTHKVASGTQSLRAMSRLQVPHPKLTYSPKTHYQIVFENGVIIDLLSNLSGVMKVLVDVVAQAVMLNVLVTQL